MSTPTLDKAQDALTQLAAFVTATIEHTVADACLEDQVYWRATQVELLQGIDGLRDLLSFQ